MKLDVEFVLIEVIRANDHINIQVLSQELHWLLGAGGSKSEPLLRTSSKYLVRSLIWTQNRAAILLFVRFAMVGLIKTGDWIPVQVSHFYYDYDIVMQDAGDPRRSPYLTTRSIGEVPNKRS